MRGFPTLWLVFGAIVLSLLPSAASAGEAEARTLFAEGRQLREQGKCREAILAFKKSLETYPEGLGAMRNIAECEEELGRFAAARRTWRDLGLAVVRSGEARYEGWERHADEARARLEPRVPKLTVTLRGEGRVLINGLPFDPRLLGTELEQDVGRVELVLEDTGAVPQSRSLALEEGQRYRVELQARPAAAKGAAAPTTPPPARGPTRSEQGPSGLMIGGIVSMAVGGAALAGMGVALGFYEGALSDVESACPDYENTPCRVDVTDSVDSGQAASAAVNVLAVAGGVGLATGVVLLVVDATSAPSDGEKAAALPFVAPLPGGAFAGLVGSF
ncbi:MAG: tetratricopeptide repeat protein [Myxococcales bacterium]|nr:tetratricopeptide repeat protein [Myxococcales bacterium]